MSYVNLQGMDKLLSFEKGDMGGQVQSFKKNYYCFIRDTIQALLQTPNKKQSSV